MKIRQAPLRRFGAASKLFQQCPRLCRQRHPIMALQKQSYSAARFGAPSIPRLCPLTRCSTDLQQKPYEQRRAETGTALLLFQRQPHLYPLCRPAAVTASARPPCYSGRSRERPAAARKQQGKKSGELFRAASAVNAVSTAAKACSGSVPPICGKNSEQRRAAPIQIYCRTKAGPVPISVPPRKNNL